MPQFANDALPIQQIRRSLADALNSAGTAVVTAPTGSGKSTQIPQYLLGDGLVEGRILVLQPRRLAARLLAERVAEEMGSQLGDAVGFQTRFERALSPRTRILFITEGLLPRMLLSNPGLAGVGAVVFDEFHERGLSSDVSLALIRDLRRDGRPDLRVVVMSATLAAEPVCAFLGDCPHLHAAGRLFPVETSYLTKPVQRDVWEAAAEAVGTVLRSEPEGDVLVFMPGVYEIRRTSELLRARWPVKSLTVLPLYGDLPPERQHEAVTRGTVRKVIVATNVAETSLTIPGVRHVVDCGLVKLGRYDAMRGFDVLETVPIARDSADQRQGRAGREAPGTCQRLWTQGEQRHKAPHTLPEVERLDLAGTVLTLKVMGVSRPSDFGWFEVPNLDSLTHAEELLVLLGAVDHAGKLTDRGRDLARFPAHPRLALLLQTAAGAGCLDEAVLAAAILSERPPTTGTLKEKRRLAREDAVEFGDQPASDFARLIPLLHEAKRRRFERDACERMGLHGNACRQIWRAADHFQSFARRADFLTGMESGVGLSRCLLRAFPDRLARRRDKGTLLCDLREGRRGELARESVAHDETLLVTTEIRETSRQGKGAKTILSLACGVREEWLLEDFPDDWEDLDEVVWGERRKQVLHRRRLACLGVLLEESESTDVPGEQAAEMLAERVLAGKLRLEGWDKDVEAWIQRTRWVASVFPERGLTEYDDTDRAVIIREICAGATRYKDIRTRSCLDPVRHALAWDDIQFVEKMAPPFFQLPCGRRMKIRYSLEQAPLGKARIQDFYGVKGTPTVAGGRVPLLLEILAPNMRTVQITDSLGRFWRELYPQVKQELARRYPKHEWR
jgi:ATP-dependent helicase HrpB